MLVGIRRWIHPASGQRCVLGLVLNGNKTGQTEQILKDKSTIKPAYKYN